MYIIKDGTNIQVLFALPLKPRNFFRERKLEILAPSLPIWSLRERHSPHPVRRVAPSLLAVSENLPPSKGARTRFFTCAEIPRRKTASPHTFHQGTRFHGRGLFNARRDNGHTVSEVARGNLRGGGCLPSRENLSRTGKPIQPRIFNNSKQSTNMALS